MHMQLLLCIETVPLSALWGFFVIFGIGGFFLVRYNPLFLIPVLLIVGFFSLAGALELNDPLVRSLIVSKEGETYITYFYWLVAIGPALLTLAGIIDFIRRWDKKNNLELEPER